MNAQMNTMTCPACGQGTIIYEIYGLLGGMKYSCPNCHAVISLSPDSQETVTDAMEKFEKLKETKAGAL